MRHKICCPAPAMTVFIIPIGRGRGRRCNLFRRLARDRYNERRHPGRRSNLNCLRIRRWNVTCFLPRDRHTEWLWDSILLSCHHRCGYNGRLRTVCEILDHGCWPCHASWSCRWFSSSGEMSMISHAARRHRNCRLASGVPALGLRFLADRRTSLFRQLPLEFALLRFLGVPQLSVPTPCLRTLQRRRSSRPCPLLFELAFTFPLRDLLPLARLSCSLELRLALPPDPLQSRFRLSAQLGDVSLALLSLPLPHRLDLCLKRIRGGTRGAGEAIA